MNGEKDKLIRDFMNAFEKKDVKVLEEFFHPNVVFRNYGDKEVRGREELLKVWSHVFGMFERVRFETFNQATNENIVIPHGRSGGRHVPVQGGNGPEQHTNHLGFRHFARG
jgi:limonene-1,2-epoxide hydrolase